MATKSNLPEIDLSTTVGSLSLSSCLYNASGPRSGTVEALKKVAASTGTGAVLSKSATLLSQTGNPQPRIHHEDYASYNSEGLPNQGIDYYIDGSNIDEILSVSSSSDKPYFVSLSGKTVDDNCQMMQRIVDSPARSKIAAIELNLACPNIVGKPTLAYDLDQLSNVLSQISRKFGKLYQQPLKQKQKQKQPTTTTTMPVFGVKMPPYLDMVQLKQVADILNKYKAPDGMLSYITTMNTMGNALAVDVSVQQPFISANGGLAGMSGRALKSTALANVWKFRQHLDPSIDIVGVGGVETGEDVIAMILCGAKAVQVGTVHWNEGPACFERLAQETRKWLHEHGHSSILEIYNELKPWSKERANEARALRKEKQVLLETASTAESGGAIQSNDASFFKLVSAVLLVIVALLSADKWHGNLLPSDS